MKMSIQKERDAMERLWKAREKQLEKVLLNAAHVSEGKLYYKGKVVSDKTPIKK